MIVHANVAMKALNEQFRVFFFNNLPLDVMDSSRFRLLQLGLVACLVVFIVMPCHAQDAYGCAPLTLAEFLRQATVYYPALRAARVEASAATEDVTAVSRQRWPALTVTTESNTGNLRTYPTQAVQVQQTLWDFGRLTSRIAEAEAVADISLLNVYLQQQDLSLQIIAAWQNMQGGRERIKVAEHALERLEGYQAQMQRRVDAQASPRIDLELVNARLLQTEVELATAKTSLQVATKRLEQLTGFDRLDKRIADAEPMCDLMQTASFTNAVNAANWFDIASEAPSVAKIRVQVRQAQHKFDGKVAETWPQLYARVFKPMNSIPGTQDVSPTYFIGLSYTPGAGLSTLAEARALGTRIAGAQLSVESALLEMQQTLQSDGEEYINARLRIQALAKAVAGSELVLASYKRQFEAGKKTWLDLLNAVRELSQNQYSLADAQASMTGAMHRLQLRMNLQPQ